MIEIKCSEKEYDEIIENLMRRCVDREEPILGLPETNCISMGCRECLKTTIKRVDNLDDHRFVLVSVSPDGYICSIKYNTHEEAYNSMKQEFDELADGDDNNYIEEYSAYVTHDYDGTEFRWKIIAL